MALFELMFESVSEFEDLDLLYIDRESIFFPKLLCTST